MNETAIEHQRDLERLRALRPIDDDFMRAMFRGDLPLAQEVLRTLTEIPDLVLTSAETQHDIRRLGNSRSICLDVYGEDSHGRRYNIEVQRDIAGADPRRARFHASAMDVEALAAGSPFRDLPETYIVFVTERDPFGTEAGLYRFERHDLGTGLELGDGSHILYANGAYRGANALGRLMHDFCCSSPNDMLTPAMAERARYLKETPKGVATMCELLEEMRQEAMEKGMQKGRLSMMADIVREGLLSVPDAAARLGMTPDQFAARAEAEGLRLA